MLILDSDHLSEFDRGSPAGARLLRRLDETTEDIAATIVSVEEQLRGWLAQIHRLHDDVDAQVAVYQRLQSRLKFFSQWTILPWDSPAAVRFLELRRSGIRIGAMDLKIAAITLDKNATLLTRNTVDFAKVPNLKFANWLD